VGKGEERVVGKKKVREEGNREGRGQGLV